MTILQGRRFADAMGYGFSACWPNLNDPNYRNENILRSDQVSEIFAHGKLFRDRDVAWHDGDFSTSKVRYIFPHQAHDRVFSPDEIHAAAGDADILFYDAPLPIRLTGANQQSEEREIRRLWQQLNFRLDVRKAVNKIVDGIDLASCVAVHVRRGDILNLLHYGTEESLMSYGMTQIFQRYIPFKAVVDTIYEKFPGSKSILVCSEDPDVSKRLQKKFPDKQVVSSAGLFPLGSNKAALLDIMLLSKAHWILAPYRSLFSECAAQVGRYAKLHNVDLDVWNITRELVDGLDQLELPDRTRRKAIVYGTAYQNLVYLPRDPFRSYALEQATKLSPEIVAKMIST